METYFETLRKDLENKTDLEISSILNETFEYLKEQIDKKFFGCVITESEDKTKFGKELKDKMPEPYEDLNFFEIQDTWARYKKAEFEKLYKVSWIPHINKDGKVGAGWDIACEGQLININSL